MDASTAPPAGALDQTASVAGMPIADPVIAGRRREHPGSEGEHELQERMGTTARADKFYDEQVLDRLNTRMREFMARQEMFFLATSDRHGACDSTFRAGPPGFLQVLDDRTFAYPEYRGNGVLASLGNIEENPHVGILMVDFLKDRIGLHVNGRARLVSDEELRRARPELPVDPVPARRAQLWVEVTVEEAYIHCAKHIPHLQKVPTQRQGRSSGPEDFKRKGGDFFGAAAEAPDRPPYQPRRRKRRVPSGARTEEPTRGALWQRSVERLLAATVRRQSDAGEEGREPFRGWFR